MYMYTHELAVLISVLTITTVTVAQEPKDVGQQVAVAYVYAADKKGAEAFQKLLDAEGFTVELIAASTVKKIDFSKYGLVIIGTDTASVVWKDVVAIIEKASMPVLGLGEGGYTFFGGDGLKLSIGSPHGAHDTGNNEQAVVPVDAEKSSLWTEAAIPGGKSIPLFKSSGNVQIYLPKPTDDLVLLGREEHSAHHYTIVRQGDRFVLWGYTGTPDSMLADGQKLFISSCRYTANLARARDKD